MIDKSKALPIIQQMIEESFHAPLGLVNFTNMTSEEKYEVIKNNKKIIDDYIKIKSKELLELVLECDILVDMPIQYEYEIFDFNAEDGKSFLKLLNQLGHEGWEMVQGEFTRMTQTGYVKTFGIRQGIFKRIKQS